jgi:hypothetical protein
MKKLVPWPILEVNQSLPSCAPEHFTLNYGAVRLSATSWAISGSHSGCPRNYFARSTYILHPMVLLFRVGLRGD